ncbi:MAG: hypothetical protein ACYTGQ_19705 [Planctomycetota bacterium]|jgi:hypothetical protein
MKLVFGSFLIIVLAGVMMFKAGWFTMEDPKQSVKNIQANVQPGMSWEQVVDLYTPRKVTPHSSPDSEVASSPIDFNPGTHEQWLKDGHYSHGFSFEYRFSQSDAVTVVFDDKGVVTYVYKDSTIGDLFNGQL